MCDHCVVGSGREHGREGTPGVSVGIVRPKLTMDSFDHVVGAFSSTYVEFSFVLRKKERIKN